MTEREEIAMMSFTGVRNLDQSIDKTNARLAEIAAEFGTEDGQFAYRVTRAWLHALRDRLRGVREAAVSSPQHRPSACRGLTNAPAFPAHGRRGW
jgi:hypothetical protein